LGDINIARDQSQLQDFIRMKTCSNFPFHQFRRFRIPKRCV
jgi:hypothetical protein